MDFDEYQSQIQETDQYPGDSDKSLSIPILGLCGEVGTLHSEYKKLLRDGEAHTRFFDRVNEELGDILWYVANLAEKCDLKLSTIAEANVEKTRRRWIDGQQSSPFFFDEGYAEDERLPERFEFSFEYITGGNEDGRVIIRDISGEQIGHSLSDNAAEADGYRFHDVLHLANAACLGWSPVLRSLYTPSRKRRSSPDIDENEDGARAAVLEEAIAAAIFAYAETNEFAKVDRVDWELLRFVRMVSRKHEVSVRTEAEWEHAILTGIETWKLVEENDGGIVTGDARERTLSFRPA